MLDLWTRLDVLPPVAARKGARSAVLVPLYRDDRGVMRLVLTKRPDTMRTHPGDVVFPGGGIEPGEGPIDAALREAWEEIALEPEDVTVIGGLEPVTTRDRTNWIIPVVGTFQRPAQFRPDPAEVEHIIEPRVSDLLDEERWNQSEWMGTELWFYEFPEGMLWGATAFMVRQLLGLLRG